MAENTEYEGVMSSSAANARYNSIAAALAWMRYEPNFWRRSECGDISFQEKLSGAKKTFLCQAFSNIKDLELCQNNLCTHTTNLLLCAKAIMTQGAKK